MNALLRQASFVAGWVALGWVGVGAIGGPPFAWLITGLIGAFYLAGAIELRRYQQATAVLGRVVAETTQAPSALAAWLDRLPAPLRQTARRRIEGEPVGFAGPALAPYLAGLLVLLGMLGTFVGMVLTLRGTGTALDSATDLQAVRDSLVAPVHGLGLAFGTSIAGVAASAALGLMSALARGERARVAQALDGRIATTLRGFSQAHRREASFALLEKQAEKQAEGIERQAQAMHRQTELMLRQAELMPALVDSLRSMTATIERQGQESAARLLANQEGFHAKAEAVHVRLAASVDRSLSDSLAEGARLATDTMRPLAESMLAGIARETVALHAVLADSMRGQSELLANRAEATHAHLVSTVVDLARQAADLQASIAESVTVQLDGVSTRLDATVLRLIGGWDDAAARQAAVNDTLASRTERALTAAAGAFEQHGAALIRTVDRAHVESQADAAARDRQNLAAMRESLEAVAESLQATWQRAAADAVESQRRQGETLAATVQGLTTHVESHVRTTLAEIGRLVQVAAEAPRAAADVIASLREKLSDGLVRDNALLDERGRLLEALSTLQTSVHDAAIEQRGAIDALVGSTAALLERVGERWAQRVDADAGLLGDAAHRVSGSAASIVQIGEDFGAAVQRFGESNDALASQLQRIEGALDKSMARSDEQLAYYVAQAREVVDLSILSQRQIIEDLQGLAARRTAGTA